MRIANNSLIKGPVDLASGWTSDAIYLGHIYMSSIQLVFTGSPEGSFKIQASNDEGNPSFGINQATYQKGVTNWTDLPNPITVTTGGSIILSEPNQTYRWMRIVWTPTTGSGSLTSARFNLKGV